MTATFGRDSRDAETSGLGAWLSGSLQGGWLGRMAGGQGLGGESSGPVWAGAGDKGGPVSGKEWERRGRSIHLTGQALPLAPGTFLSTESWEGWRSRKGVSGTLGKVGVRPQTNPNPGCPLLAVGGAAEPGLVADLPFLRGPGRSLGKKTPPLQPTPPLPFIAIPRRRET